jgi:hypothetical protein
MTDFFEEANEGNEIFRLHNTLVTIWLTTYRFIKQIYIYVYVKYGRCGEIEKNTTYVTGNLNSLTTSYFMRNDTKRNAAFFHFGCGRRYS